ncbi:NAD(P)-binding protein [Lindgomyces ingoldianus]|uniref:NAD(P)-binding protein n=1 Tax=Lindgomyces ingoldianus TaxID=673940 RepID=A0ACB6RG58_9PLEO|nr:NAD(P)-binding protein [Lindgomyces ingoldianus]KAF2478244.1 NAD(P)-binding protein [Lindgomyces ingoldianus]
MPMKRVLLTGANNLIGSHILDQLLTRNVAVRAVVGSRDEALSLQQQYPVTGHPTLDFAIVPQKDIAVPGAYDLALSGSQEPFDTVIHTVPPDPSEEADCLSRFINVETEALISFLRSIKEVAPRVQRVIVTTSLTPFARWLVDPQVERIPRIGNPSSPTAAEIDSEYVLATSRASDNIVCDAVWKWSKDTPVGFDLVSLAAPSIYGPSIRPLSNSSDLEDANRRIWNICSNNFSELVTSPPYGIDYYTDVRDLAFANVQAVFMPEARNKRFLISAGAMPAGSVIAEFLRNQFPEFGSRIRPDSSPPRQPISGDPPIDFVDTHLAASILGLVRYRMAEETLTDLARQILELHRRKEWKRVIQS